MGGGGHSPDPDTLKGNLRQIKAISSLAETLWNYMPPPGLDPNQEKPKYPNSDVV